MLEKKNHIKIILLLAFILTVSFSLNAQNSIEHYYRALAFQKYKKTARAEHEFLSAINLEKENYVYRIALGKLYFKNFEYAKAKKQLIAAEKIRPNSASLLLSKVYSREQNVDSAIFYLKKYLGYYKKIPKNEIINDSNFVDIQNNPKWKKLWAENYYSRPDKMLQDAEYTLKFSNYTDALTKVNFIIKKYKKFAPAYFLKAQILTQGKNYKKALTYFDKAIYLNARKTEYYIQRAKCFVYAKKYANAIADFKKYMKLNPYDISVYKEIANAYASNKQYSKALDAIGFYVRFFDKDNDAYFQMAQINYDAGNYLTTIRIMNNLFSEEPPNVKYFHLRALAYMNANSYKMAYHDFSQCLDLDPTKTGNYYYRGIVNLKMNKIENACADWKNSLKNDDYRANDYFYKYCRDYN